MHLYIINIVQLEEVPALVAQLATGRRTWEQVLKEFPVFEQQESDAAEFKASKK